MTPKDEFIPTERIALIVYLLSQGYRFTTSQAARRVGITTDGAALMLRKASRVIPICEEKGLWKLYSGEDPDPI